MLALATLAAMLQVSVLSEIATHPFGVPLLPVALVAGWAAMRSADALWPVLLVTPLVQGVLAAERVGWLLIALLPAVILGAVLTQPWSTQRPAGPGRRIAIAALIASSGTVLHAAIRSLASGTPALLFESSGAVLTSVAWTVFLAVAFAVSLWPLRPRTRGLFA